MLGRPFARAGRDAGAPSSAPMLELTTPDGDAAAAAATPPPGHRVLRADRPRTARSWPPPSTACAARSRSTAYPLFGATSEHARCRRRVLGGRTPDGRRTDARPGLGLPRLARRARRRHRPLRRQHLVRGGPPRPAGTCSCSTPAPGCGRSVSRCDARRCRSGAHPPHPPPPRPPPGPRLLPAALRSRHRDPHLGPAVAGAVARGAHRDVPLAAAVPGAPGRHPGADSPSTTHRPSDGHDRLGDRPGRAGHAPGSDGRLPHRGGRPLARVPARPRAVDSAVDSRTQPSTGSAATTSPATPTSCSTTPSTATTSTRDHVGWGHSRVARRRRLRRARRTSSRSCCSTTTRTTPTTTSTRS